MFYTKNDVSIARTCLLKDVQLISNKINIESGFEGCGQFYSQESFECKDANLIYPSIIVCQLNTLKEEHMGISISNSTIWGALYFESKNSNRRKSSGVVLDPKSTVIGKVCSNTWVELSGGSIGSS